MAVVNDIIEALTNLNGVGKLKDIFIEYQKINPNAKEPSMRNAIETNSSDSSAYKGRHDYFFSVNGIGGGMWGLRNFIIENDNNYSQQRVPTIINRIIRDTALAISLKKQSDYSCQICKERIVLRDGSLYAEAHHIKPLGNPYNGPDIKENIIILCPNCHVKCDYKSIPLELENINNNFQGISTEFIDFHNSLYNE